MPRRRIILYPYSPGSESCRDLSLALREKYHGKVLRVHSGGRYHPRARDAVINWGNPRDPAWIHGMMNKPSAVALSIDKLRCFQVLHSAGVSAVPHTTSRTVATGWPQIVERHVVGGHGGAGIVLSTPETIADAPLYTRLMAPANEYRVHVFMGKVIDYTKKIKRTDDRIVSRADNDYIKNLDAGWEFIRDVAPRESVKTLALAAIEALGLDFGSVDIIRHNRVNYFLETGTAPGLSPIGLQAYSNAILRAL